MPSPAMRERQRNWLALSQRARAQAKKRELVRKEVPAPENRARAERLRHQQAHKIAEALLIQHLNRVQAEEYRKERRFHVGIGERCYVIYHDGEVRLMNAEGDVEEVWCVFATANVPASDNMLALKLHLEANEAGLRRTAVRTSLRAK